MEVHKQEFKVRDLPTRSVTLFPSRAQVVRDIKDVVLQPGANQIAVVGFSPTVDESSIKVEGTGSSAIISDIAVELLPNRDIYEDFYPDSDSDSGTGPESDSELDDEIESSAELKAAREKLTALTDEQKLAEETVASSQTQLQILDAYGKMLDRKRNVDIGVGIATYREERAKAFASHVDGALRIRNLSGEIAKATKAVASLARKHQAAQLKVDMARLKKQRARQKDKATAQRRKQEAIQEKQRIRAERSRFWPRKCYTVRISLDVPSFTPATSRRSSVASLEFAKDAAAEAAASSASSPAPAGKPAGEGDAFSAVGDVAPTVDLAISYVTSSAGWSPTYDLQLSTTANTGKLCFDASLTNTTSESWANCKIVLSTSQTTFSGLHDAIPVLVPWKVKLVHRSGGGSDTDGLLHSREEAEHNRNWRLLQHGHPDSQTQQPRGVLFGLDPANTSQRLLLDPPSLQKDIRTLAKEKRRLQIAQQAQQAQQGASPLIQQALSFGTSSNYVVTGHVSRSRGPPMMAAPMMAAPPPQMVGVGDGDMDGATIMPEAAAALAFQESVFEETGLTSTYDLPGLKTLVPSATASKQRVTRISFGQVVFSHTVVAKYKPAAYLKAKVKNTSNITILKGPAGLTVDGSFMGRTALPRCSPGDMFVLSLGVDPAIRVFYPKPDVKRATTGFLSKENSNAYKRSIIISNARAAGAAAAKGTAKSASMLVLDQVPVSEDEKLRVDIQQPRGLTVGGPRVETGTGTFNAANSTGSGAGVVTAKDWGTATATLRKAGEVVWEVKLNAGRTVKLALEYDVGVPTGESVTQC